MAIILYLMCSSISVRLSIFHQPEDNAFFLESTIAKRTQLFVSVKLYDKTTIESRHTLHHLKDKQRHHVKYSLWNKIYGHDLKVRLKHGVSFRSLWFFLSKWFSNIFVKINCSVSIFYCMLFSVDILLYVLCLHVALLSFHCYDYVCVPMSERVSMSNIVLTLLSICSTISWREQFTFWWNDDDDEDPSAYSTIPNTLNLHISSSLKQ
jgi:hypothetical protein